MAIGNTAESRGQFVVTALPDELAVGVFATVEGVASWDCARTVKESNVFIALGLVLTEKQIPKVVENSGNQNNGQSD
jgi:hypothetical protein